MPGGVGGKVPYYPNNHCMFASGGLCDLSVANISVSAMLPVLQTLQMSHNKLETVSDIHHLTLCPKLSVVDLSHNNIQSVDVVQVSCLHTFKISSKTEKCYTTVVFYFHMIFPNYLLYCKLRF